MSLRSLLRRSFAGRRAIAALALMFAALTTVPGLTIALPCGETPTGGAVGGPGVAGAPPVLSSG